MSKVLLTNLKIKIPLTLTMSVVSWQPGYKENSGGSKVKNSTVNLTSMIYESFIFELYFGIFHFGIGLLSYCEDKK